jgi:hypothetical protein
MTQSSPFENGLAADSSTGEIITLKYPELSLEAPVIVNIKNLEVSNCFVTFMWPLIVDVESSIVLK